MKMIDVLPIIVGINHWRDVTSPFLDTIRQFHPTAPLVVVDNHSTEPYPAQDDIIMLRTNRRMGYNEAMNFAAAHSPTPRWYVFFNNDCLARFPFIDDVGKLNPRVMYGSGWNFDGHMMRNLQWSAWMCISREMWEAVGEFDPLLTAGFEDFDYQLRVEKAGYKIDTACLPVEHMDRHTRKEEPYYRENWQKSRKHFAAKWNWFIPDLTDGRAGPC